MRSLDCYQLLASAQILAYEKQCWQVIKSGQLQNEERLAALGQED